MTTETKEGTKKFSLLDFCNNHSKTTIVALVILVGATVVIAGCLYYYRDSLGYRNEGIEVNNPTQEEINEALNTAALFGTVQSKTSTTMVIKSGSKSYTLNFDAKTSFTKGVEMTKVSVNEVKTGESVNVSYSKDNNYIISLSFGV